MRANKDIYTVEANQEDFLTLLEVAEKASVSLSTVFLPATIDILVHEYNSTHQEPPIEYKDLLTDDRSIRENLKLISSYLKEIDVKDDLLVIVDNYIFPQRFDDSYANDLLDLIEGSGAIQVTIMTSSIINENLKENIKQELAKRGIKLSVYSQNEFHDRFWLSPKSHSGFILGTSLNGIGKKISCIHMLSLHDAHWLIEKLCLG